MLLNRSTDDTVDHSPDPQPDESAHARRQSFDDAVDPAEEDSSIVGRIRDSLFGG